MHDLVPYGAAAETEESLGPKMRALTVLQRRFVLILVGCANNATEAARLAGYSGDNDTLAKTATRLRHTPAVQDAIDEEARKSLYGAKLLAVQVLRDVLEDPTEKTHYRLKAVAMVLNRVGMPEVFNQSITVEHKLSSDELIKNIGDMARKLNLDPKQLLGSYGITIDAEYTEVPAELTDGLEDVL